MNIQSSLTVTVSVKLNQSHRKCRYFACPCQFTSWAVSISYNNSAVNMRFISLVLRGKYTILFPLVNKLFSYILCSKYLCEFNKPVQPFFLCIASLTCSYVRYYCLQACMAMGVLISMDIKRQGPSCSWVNVV